MNRIALLITLAVGFIAGCDWVDSTGVQSDAPLVQLEEGQVIRLQEGLTKRLDPGINPESGGGQQTFSWDSEPLQQGALPGCSGLEDFNAAIAAASVSSACVESDGCELYFAPEQISDDLGVRTGFRLIAPLLAAPVGVTYQLHATDANGIESQANFTFCLIAINDPPIAANDSYAVVEGESLTVSPDSAKGNLLSNDLDDVDVRNQPLRVLSPALRAPVLHEVFVLGESGDFIYIPDPTIVLEAGETLTDSFEYTITDGTSESSATVLINITATNEPPEQIETISEIIAIAGIEQKVAFSEYFRDPEGSELAFSIAPGTLPVSGKFRLSAAGVLTGIATENDIGSWPLEVIASDGVNTLSAEFTLTVDDNLSPGVRQLPAVSVDLGDTFSFNVSQYFTDPEKVALIYSLSGNGIENLVINKNTGVISGRFTNPGSYRLTVGGSDGYNPEKTATIAVAVADIPNRSPLYTGSIPNQSVELGQPIAFIQGDFSDLDGDTLAYSMVGSLPPGIVLNQASGTVSGTATEIGAYTNLRIVATDPDGESVQSDSFSLTITALVPNRRPVYAGSLSNQTVTLGNSIKPISGNFTDPDGDTLSITVDGTLPAGLQLSALGILSGAPTAVGASANLRLRATDPDGLFVVSDPFRITVIAAPPAVNSGPRYSGSIGNQTVEIGEAIEPIVGGFTDPDGDALTYSMVGVLPDKLKIDKASGIISGIVNELGTYANLRLVATDPDGLSVRSDTFRITVVWVPLKILK